MTALDRTVYVLSRTKPVTIAVAGAVLTAPLTDAYGTWSSDAASVTFQPGTVPGTGVVSVPRAYTVGGAAGTLTLVFVAPGARTQSNVSRVGGPVSFPSADVGTPAKASVWLWDGANRQTSIERNGHKWSVADDGVGIELKLSNKKFVQDSEQVEFVLSDGVDNSPTATAKATFTTATEAFPILVTGPASTKIDVDVNNYCYVQAPKTITSITLTNNADPTRIQVEAPQSKPTVLSFNPGNMGARMDTANYQVTDSANGKSNVALARVTFTAMSMRARPMAANCLVAKSAAPGQIRVAPVLDGAVAYHGVDKASVKIVGPVDLGVEDNVNTTGLAADGKTMFVPNQGVWLVDDSGAISFQADQNFTGAPTPAAFTFADQKGNVSAPAVVVFNDALAALTGLPAKIKTLDDASFWTDYRTHVSRLHPALAAGEFLAATHGLAWAVGLAAEPKANPVSLDDYDTAYQAWLDGGQAWDDAPGAVPAVGLVTICEQLVAKTGATGLLARYWRLQHMAHMVAQALPGGAVGK